MHDPDELIVAVATVAGPGARAILRLSGAGLAGLLETLFRFPAAGPRDGVPTRAGGPTRLAARLASAAAGAAWADLPVTVLWWPGPGGPTGGPLAEVQLPAAPPLVDLLTTAACRAGARPARGGEFSLRGWLAGRLDLAAAEAVLAVVDARSPEQLATALDGLAGGGGRHLRAVREQLLDLAADLEAVIDFGDERAPDAIPSDPRSFWGQVVGRLDAAIAALEAGGGRLRVRGVGGVQRLPRVVLTGLPNIGKSSLFNALAGRPAALVADEPGTTRDWVDTLLTVADAPLCVLVDVAGRGTEHPGADPLAHAAAAVATAQVEAADVVVACHDAADPTALPAVPPGKPLIVVATRCDRAGARPSAALATSAVTGAGLVALRTAIRDAVARLPPPDTPATVRLAAGIAAALEDLATVRSSAVAGAAGGRADEVVVASGVARAVAALGEVTGIDAPAELLDRIFARHCIGK
jgi:tRNA modification GTPase